MTYVIVGFVAVAGVALVLHVATLANRRHMLLKSLRAMGAHVVFLHCIDAFGSPKKDWLWHESPSWWWKTLIALRLEDYCGSVAVLYITGLDTPHAINVMRLAGGLAELRGFVLAGPDIDDEVFANIPLSCKMLRAIWITDSSISFKCLTRLNSFAALAFLSYKGTGITEGELLRTLPTCDIEFEYVDWNAVA